MTMPSMQPDFYSVTTTGEVIWHEGWMSIMEVVADTEPEADDGDFDDGFVGGPITEAAVIRHYPFLPEES